jgi:N-acetylglutamate synthase-like GNAT family acetyltransferase
MRLRRAGPDDAPAIHDVLEQTAGDGVLAPGRPELGDVEALLRSESAGAFVAALDDRDVGAALFDRQGDVVWLFRLAVAPHARAHGVGRALVNAVEARAKDAGASAVFVQVAKHMEARSFFEHIGYEPDVEEPDVVAGRSITLVDLVKLV